MGLAYQSTGKGAWDNFTKLKSHWVALRMLDGDTFFIMSIEKYLEPVVGGKAVMVQ